MPDRVDATVDGEQAARIDPLLDHVAREAEQQ
jgi:hypothetical protein